MRIIFLSMTCNPPLDLKSDSWSYNDGHVQFYVYLSKQVKLIYRAHLKHSSHCPKCCT